jgi:hypothetical protein
VLSKQLNTQLCFESGKLENGSTKCNITLKLTNKDLQTRLRIQKIVEQRGITLKKLIRSANLKTANLQRL